MSRVMIIAGEVSGDMLASSMVKAANRMRADLEWFGIGGPLMRAEGVETLHDVSEMAVMGLAEVLKRYPFFRRVLNEMVELAETRRPDAVVLVDYPGFNLRLAEKLHERGVKVVYFVCPQVWAWHRERIPKMAKIIDRLITIFPFEADYFKDTGLRVSYAGHPLVDEMREVCRTPPAELPWRGGPRLALLPGSRQQEIKRLLPAMLQAANLLTERERDLSVIIAAAGEKQADTINTIAADIPAAKCFTVVTGKTRDILRTADAALTASGTATVETALLRCPMVVVYRVNFMTYQLAKRLIRIENIGMVNVLAGKQICPELLQHDMTPQKMADALQPLLSDTPQRRRMLEELDRVIAYMGEGGAAEHAAGILLEELDG